MKTIHEHAKHPHGLNRAKPLKPVIRRRRPALATGILTASLLGSLALVTPAWAFPGGVAGYAGAPGDPGPGQSQTCSVCHSGGSFEGSLTVSLPAKIVVNEVVPIDVFFTGTGEPPVRWGFNLIALENEVVSPQPVGDLIHGPGSQILESHVEWEYLSHTFAGNMSEFEGKPGWTVAWQAPSEAVESVRFYATFNASNGDGQTGSTIFEPPESVVRSVPEPGAASAALVALCALAAARRPRRD